MVEVTTTKEVAVWVGRRCFCLRPVAPGLINVSLNIFSGGLDTQARLSLAYQRRKPRREGP
jgi:hypothetical protein